MIRTATTLALLLAATTLTQAQSVEDAISDFIFADGFAVEDIFALDATLENLWLDTTGIAPGGNVGPVEKAILLATNAIPSTRTRTTLAYGEMVEELDGAFSPVSFVEVRHYNLGPAIRADTAEAYGEENTADLEEFGIGDHMAWRFVFRPMMGNQAVLIDAASRIISGKQASKDDCEGRPCLDLYSGFDDMAEWQEIEGTLPVWPLQFADKDDEVTTPAYAVSQLAVLGFWANAEGGSYQWTGGEHPEGARGYEPYRFVTIDRNLGQELFIDTVWQETKLNDDELYSISFRLLDIAGWVSLMRASETY